MDKKRLSVWPVLAFVIMLVVLLFVLFLQQKEFKQPVVYQTPAKEDDHKQIFLANVLSAFADQNLTIDTNSTSSEEIPVVSTDVLYIPTPVQSSEPALIKKTTVAKLTKTTTKILLPKPIPKLDIVLDQKATSTTTSNYTTATTTNTYSNIIPDLFEVKMKGGGGSFVSGGGGGGGTPAPAAPAPAPVPAPTPTPDPTPVPPPVVVPDAPTALNATAGDAQVSLSWTVPASSGSSGLTDYEIHQSNDNFVANNITLSDEVGTSTTAYVVTGLTNTTTYYFKVYAVSSAGTSAASNLANATPVAPPAPEPPPDDEPPPLPDGGL